MGNYNPKTAYQFRWQDAKNLQKFIQGQLIVHDVNFDVSSGQDVKIYKFDTVPEAKGIAETAKYCYDNGIPLIIYDYASNETWISTQCASETEVNISRTIDNQILTAFIDIYDDRIEVSAFSHEMLSIDNVKTLFGTESIIGTGNIDLFNHFLTVTASDGSKLYINYPSSNNLECDSLQDLTKMTKAINGTKIGFGSTYINYNGSIWQTANSTAITAVSDVVTTL